MSVALGLNYSPAAADLVRAGKIRIDRFKCADWPDMIAAAGEYCQPYVHFPLGLGTPGTRDLDLSAISAMLAETKTPFVNVHVSPKLKDFPGLTDDADPDASGMYNTLATDLKRLTDHFGPDRVIVESIPYGNPVEGFYRPAAEPELVRRLIEEFNAGLLLDLSHARITARKVGRDEWDLIETFPTGRLRELHVTGTAYIGEIFKDHLPMRDEDWTFFDRAIDRIRTGKWTTPWAVVSEYGGTSGFFATHCDPEVIERDTVRMGNAVAQL